MKKANEKRYKNTILFDASHVISAKQQRRRSQPREDAYFRCRGSRVEGLASNENLNATFSNLAQAILFFRLIVSEVRSLIGSGSLVRQRLVADRHGFHNFTTLTCLFV